MIDFDDVLAAHHPGAGAATRTSPTRSVGVSAIARRRGPGPQPPPASAVDLLRDGRYDLFLVGDPAQAIYGFNGADPTLLVDVEDPLPRHRDHPSPDEPPEYAPDRGRRPPRTRRQRPADRCSSRVAPTVPSVDRYRTRRRGRRGSGLASVHRGWRSHPRPHRRGGGPRPHQRPDWRRSGARARPARVSPCAVSRPPDRRCKPWSARPPHSDRRRGSGRGRTTSLDEPSAAGVAACWLRHRVRSGPTTRPRRSSAGSQRRCSTSCGSSHSAMAQPSGRGSPRRTRSTTRSTDGVDLLTFHAAKGREWHTVARDGRREAVSFPTSRPARPPPEGPRRGDSSTWP